MAKPVWKKLFALPLNNMNYIFKTSYRLNNSPLPRDSRMVLLVEAEPEASAVYKRHLTQATGLEVAVCLNLLSLSQQLQDLRPDLLIINPMPNLKASLKSLLHAKQLYPGLLIITLGYAIPDDYLDRFMKLGVSAHINRHLSRPQDVALAAQQVLNY